MEIWGRGTNRVIESCHRYGIDPPSFEERDGVVYVTFKAQVRPQGEVTPQVLAILLAATRPRTRGELQDAAELKDREHFRNGYLEPLIEAGPLEMTLPDKPTSSLQRYPITAAGEKYLADGGDKSRSE